LGDIRLATLSPERNANSLNRHHPLAGFTADRELGRLISSLTLPRRSQLQFVRLSYTMKERRGSSGAACQGLPAQAVSDRAWRFCEVFREAVFGGAK
jgi:hypothetical protein